MKIKQIPVKDIIPYAKNARKNEEAVEPVMNSIKEFGFKVPIVIDSENVIVAGHTRLMAAKRLKMTEVPCIIADDLTPEQVKAYRLADNKTAEIAEWDYELLEAELLEISSIDMESFGFELTAEEIRKECVEDNFDALAAEPRAKRGDIFQLGRHRLMCGDATNPHDVKTLMGGNLADISFTDPPYGMKKEIDGILNDNQNAEELLDFNKRWIPISFNSIKDNGSWYCFGIEEPLFDIYAEILKPMIRNKEIAFRNMIVWHKMNPQGICAEDFRCYPPAAEMCLFVMKGSESAQGFSVNADDYSENMDVCRLYLLEEIKKLGQTDDEIAKGMNLGFGGATIRHWYSKSQFFIPTRRNYERLREYGKEVLKNADYLKRDYDDLKRDYDDLKRDFYASRSYFDNSHGYTSVWEIKTLAGAEREETGGHASPKPLELCGRAIKSSTREGETVLDLFGGSGSTLMACEQLNRSCYMMELGAEWCDVTIDRWEKFTGGKAVKTAQ